MKIPSVYRHLLSHPRSSFIKVLSQMASYLWRPKVNSGKSRNPRRDLTLSKTTGMTYSSHRPWRWLSETALWHHNGFLMTHSLEISSKTPHLALVSQRTGVGGKRYVFIITHLSLFEHHLHLFSTSERVWRSQSAGKASPPRVFLQLQARPPLRFTRHIHAEQGLISQKCSSLAGRLLEQRLLMSDIWLQFPAQGTVTVDKLLW